jgi:hypothetical protein
VDWLLQDISLYRAVGVRPGRRISHNDTYYKQTCTWDLYGNLLSVVPGAPTAEAPLYTGEISVGATCSITITYDPAKLATPTGLAYDTLNVAVTSDAGQAMDFIQSYTVVVRLSDQEDGGN